jgi:hypothetical protein
MRTALGYDRVDKEDVTDQGFCIATFSPFGKTSTNQERPQGFPPDAAR